MQQIFIVREYKFNDESSFLVLKCFPFFCPLYSVNIWCITIINSVYAFQELIKVINWSGLKIFTILLTNSVVVLRPANVVLVLLPLEKIKTTLVLQNLRTFLNSAYLYKCKALGNDPSYYSCTTLQLDLHWEDTLADTIIYFHIDLRRKAKVCCLRSKLI